MSVTLRAVVLIGLASMGGAACSTARASTPVERPPLEVPPPPPRVVVPPPAAQQTLQPVQNLPVEAPVIPRPRPARDKDAAKPEPKSEEKPTEPPPVEEKPPAQLRIPDTANAAQLATQIQETIARANALRTKIHYAPLSNVGKKAYDDSKLFAGQAEDALKANNLAFAKELADKAERLAKELQGRR